LGQDALRHILWGPRMRPAFTRRVTRNLAGQVRQKNKYLISLVPGEGFEPPTNGLQAAIYDCFY
jgi:hypothetical protein